MDNETIEASGDNLLGTQPIPRLLVRYAVPSIVSMLVMSLYNIVDQIFIGWGVGYIGNTATTVTFPLVTVGLAVSLLVGNGSAAFISLELGRGHSGNAKKTVGNAVAILAVSGILYALLILLFMRPVLLALGATESVMSYAEDYGSVIMIGMPFAMMGTGLSNVIRADGSPRYSMAFNLVGALLNIILDPIYIFVFHMGVRGAAIATVISQIISCAMALFYILRRANYVQVSPGHLRPDGALIRQIMALGSSSFITQAAITVVNVVLNNSLRHYGALSPYGAEVPLAAMGIVMKVNSILISAMLGFAIGAQPILGFNYGAGNYARVRKTYLTVVSMTLAVSTLCWLVFITTPETIVNIFGDNSPQFNEFASKAMRTFLGAIVCIGIQLPSANYFQAVGKPLKAMVLTMCRQLLFFIPSILLLPVFLGLEGILYAGPVADLCALTITATFIVKEMRHLGKTIASGTQPQHSPHPIG